MNVIELTRNITCYSIRVWYKWSLWTNNLFISMRKLKLYCNLFFQEWYVHFICEKLFIFLLHLILELFFNLQYYCVFFIKNTLSLFISLNHCFMGWVYLIYKFLFLFFQVIYFLNVLLALLLVLLFQILHFNLIVTFYFYNFKI